MKSLLIALQYHHKAAPGRLIHREPEYGILRGGAARLVLLFSRWL